jgi:CheY-like chemotaxis protein
MARTLLVVEDEPSIADLLLLALRLAGYRVEVVGDGRAALRRLAEERYDLVLSDVMLPYLDGLGLARAMQDDPALRAIPLVLMSAVHQPPDGVVPYAAFLAKPFDLDRLLATVARLLGPDVGG